MRKTIILNIFILIGLVSCGYSNYNCDFRFGDPSWHYSKVFHNDTYIIASGTTHKHIYLDTDRIVSFVCVNVSDARADVSDARVSFASLFKRISVELPRPYGYDVTAQVLAMHHGY